MGEYVLINSSDIISCSGSRLGPLRIPVVKYRPWEEPIDNYFPITFTDYSGQDYTELFTTETDRQKRLDFLDKLFKVHKQEG